MSVDTKLRPADRYRMAMIGTTLVVEDPETTKIHYFNAGGGSLSLSARNRNASDPSKVRIAIVGGNLVIEQPFSKPGKKFKALPAPSISGYEKKLAFGGGLRIGFSGDTPFFLRGSGASLSARTGLLDLYPGAAAAYSTVGLSSSFTGNVVDVRRSGDDAESGFTAVEVEDGTLAAWVVAGGGTEDGFVKTWYDQSGNGNDATQTTQANQPQIVSSGTLVTENGKPAVDFDGATDYLTGPDIAWADYTLLSAFTISTPDVTNATQVPWGIWDSGASQRAIIPTYYVSGATHSVAADPNGAGTAFQIRGGGTVVADTQYLLSYVYDGSQAVADEQKAWQNGSSLSLGSDSDVVNSFHNSTAATTVGSVLNSGAGVSFLNGTIQSIVVYNSDQSANRTGIEGWLNTEFSVY